MIPVVTIDGPSGAGKGTLSRLVANELGFHLLDSGALYRLTGVACDRKSVDMNNFEAVATVAAELDITFVVGGESTRVMLEGDDVSKVIREEKSGMLASKVGGNPLAREALLERQRVFRELPGLVADGRDMGTTIFPDATLKIFLTASAPERAKRRVLQLESAGHTADYEKILEDIEIRDMQDKNRASSPLVAAEDAIEIDSTALTIDAVFQKIIALYHQNINR